MLTCRAPAGGWGKSRSAARHHRVPQRAAVGPAAVVFGPRLVDHASAGGFAHHHRDFTQVVRAVRDHERKAQRDATVAPTDAARDAPVGAFPGVLPRRTWRRWPPALTCTSQRTPSWPAGSCRAGHQGVAHRQLQTVLHRVGRFGPLRGQAVKGETFALLRCACRPLRKTLHLVVHQHHAGLF